MTVIDSRKPLLNTREPHRSTRRLASPALLSSLAPPEPDRRTVTLPSPVSPTKRLDERRLPVSGHQGSSLSLEASPDAQSRTVPGKPEQSLQPNPTHPLWTGSPSGPTIIPRAPDGRIYIYELS